MGIILKLCLLVPLLSALNTRFPLFGIAGGGGSDSGFSSDSTWSSGSSWSTSDYGGSNSSASHRPSCRKRLEWLNASEYEIKKCEQEQMRTTTLFWGATIALTILLYYVESWLENSRLARFSRSVPERIDSMRDQALARKIIYSSDHNTTAQEQLIHSEAKHIFSAYQATWSKNDISSLQSKMTPEYYRHASLMLEAMRSLGRRNSVENVKLQKISLINSIDDQTTLPLNVTVYYQFSADDRLLDEAPPFSRSKPKVLYVDRYKSAHEAWNYVFDGAHLYLAGIKQPTVSTPHLIASLRTFAEENLLAYSPDYGRFLLPSKGLIFSRATFSSADVNNHIIGKWKNTLVQLYSYSSHPEDPSLHYLVGQLALSKKYSGIQIIPNSSTLIKHHPKEYQKHSLEWEDFNRRYTLYSAPDSTLPAFELMNPKFMEQLYALKPDCALEVIGNILLFYLPVRHVTLQDYKSLLDILILAYKELKL